MQRTISALFIAAVLAGPALLDCTTLQMHSPVALVWYGRPEGLRLARNAAQEWFDVCGVSAFIVDPDGAELAGTIPLEEVANSNLLKYPTRLGETYLDSHNYATGVRVVILPDPAIEQTVITHELGHVFGFPGHTTRGLMRSYIDGVEHVTPYECSLLPPP